MELTLLRFTTRALMEDIKTWERLTAQFPSNT